jgi:two-component system, chemotaxis family, chemotaxis protein CheY
MLQPADAIDYVLVVDDDDDIRDCLVGYLEDEGFHPIGVSNGKRALEMLTGAGPRPSVIVLDLMMPVMDGRGFREEQLRAAELADIPVVLISAYANLVETARELKVAQYLSKPIDPLGLLTVIRQYCRPDPPLRRM